MRFPLFRFKLLAALAFAQIPLIFSPSMARAAASSEASCETIHRYESYCGNLAADTCARNRQGFDYWHNAEHKQVWDDFFNLCGQDQSRNSRDCIAFLGIGAQCVPNSEAPPPLATRYEEPTVLQVANPPPLATRYEEPLQYGVLQPVPVSVAYNPPVEYQVCCGTRAPAATPLPVETPPAEVPEVPVPTSAPEQPILATPTPVNVPPAQVTTSDDAEKPAIDGETSSSDQASGGGKVTTGSTGLFQMSGTGCSLQGADSNPFASFEWIVLALVFAGFTARRASKN